MREHLGDCTILTIAHRLATILDYDKVLVMAAQELEGGAKGPGTVAEFDTPLALLRSGGIFSEMVQAGGLNVADEIRKLEASAEAGAQRKKED